jgi:glutathione S-transferase
VHQYVYGLLKEQLKVPNNHLKGKSYFVGGALTLVDIFFTLVQCELQQAVLDNNYRNSMANINAHFKLMAAEAPVRRRCGNLKQGKKSVAPFLLGESGGTAGMDLNKL